MITSQITLADLIGYARKQAKITAIDYFDRDPRFVRAHEISAWRKDRKTRDNARALLFSEFPGRLLFAPEDEKLIPGNYGRLEITENRIEYTARQYSPVEIYDAILNYLRQTND